MFFWSHNEYKIVFSICKRLLSFAAAAAAAAAACHDNDERKEINAIQKARIDENHFYDKDDDDEF